MEKRLTDSVDPPTIRFGEFRFDASSGELWRHDNGKDGVVRLAPQPARLLALLIGRRPHVVGADEIRRTLWPDVQVEFEQSLRTCVRQIRHALNDSATEPRYIETLPRRGYRFLARVETETEKKTGIETETEPTQAPARRKRSRVSTSGLAIVLGLGILLAAVSMRLDTSLSSPPVRVAVMPLEPPPSAEGVPTNNDLAESLVEILVRRHPALVEVIGPTTTSAYAGEPLRYRELGEELDIDVVVHARTTRSEAGARILVEIIRAADGAHLWARYLDDLPSAPGTAQAIAEGVLATLE